MSRHQALDELHSYTDSLLREEGSTPTVLVGVAQSGGWEQRWRSPQVALASLGFLVFGNIGMAAASNSAVPGDVLYPVDRAFESVAGVFGVDVGGATERLEEAAVLIGRGQFDAAIELIAVAAADLDEDAAAAIEPFAADFAEIDSSTSSREEIHQATLALLATVHNGVVMGRTDDLATWREAVSKCVEDLANTANGQPFTPPGQDDTFVPPGQDEGSTPPGLEDKETPPGLEDKETPPGLEDKETPPGLEDKETPPGLEDKETPPGLESAPIPIEESPPQDLDDEFTPPGRDDDFTPPGKAKDKPKGGRNQN